MRKPQTVRENDRRPNAVADQLTGQDPAEESRKELQAAHAAIAALEGGAAIPVAGADGDTDGEEPLEVWLQHIVQAERTRLVLLGRRLTAKDRLLH